MANLRRRSDTRNLDSRLTRHRFDVRLQFWPARKTVLSRQGVLCVSESGGGISLPHVVQQLLCLLSEILQIRMRRQVTRHIFSFIARCPLTGKEEVDASELSSRCAGGIVP